MRLLKVLPTLCNYSLPLDIAKLYYGTGRARASWLAMLTSVDISGIQYIGVNDIDSSLSVFEVFKLKFCPHLTNCTFNISKIIVY